MNNYKLHVLHKFSDRTRKKFDKYEFGFSEIANWLLRPVRVDMQVCVQLGHE